MPTIDAGVSESDVLSMFDKDGDLRDEPQTDDEESGAEGEEAEDQEQEETEAEPEEEPEEEEAEESEDEESDEEAEEPEADLDWSKVPPEHKAAHEADQKEIAKLRKDYGKLHSKYAESSQSRREEDQSLQELRASAQMATEWNSILEQHPELVDIMVKEVNKLRNPLPDEVPEELKDDPAFQYMKQRYEPYIRKLESELNQFKGQMKPLNDWQAEKAQAVNRQKLDGLLDEAGKEFKNMFGKDMSEEDRTAVLKYMVEKKYYDSGSNAALSVFGSQYKKTLSAKRTSDLKAKANKFGGRGKSVNSNRASSAPKISNQTDAIKQALADQGLEV